MIRVVSLVPSLTETLFALGAGESVVAITDWCIFPAGLTLPRVGGTKNPNIAAIRELQPDLVYMNSEENLKRHADEIAQFAEVHVSEPRTIDDVRELFATLARIHEKDATPLIDALQRERDSMPQPAFTFAVPIWKKPWMWCGGDTYVSHLVEAAGGVNVMCETRYPSLALEEVLERKPDVIFLPDEPYAFTEDDATAIDAHTIGPFPGHLFTWHGARTIEGLRFLCRTSSQLVPGTAS
ncbi:MAG TPA: helical backbone metal receptor [Thermoanaerobaculia bacterium]|nr:helical backbone metal receptor [Thermoanaerobaculia bacterium]